MEIQLAKPINRQEMLAPYLVPEDHTHILLHENKFHAIPVDYLQENESRKDFLLRTHVSNPI